MIESTKPELLPISSPSKRNSSHTLTVLKNYQLLEEL